MTRTYLMQVASQIVERPLESFVDPCYYGTISIGKFLKKPFYCLTNLDEETVAIIYNQTLYCTIPVSPDGARAIKEFYNLFKCNTKVFLYPNKSNILYSDETGEVRNSKSAAISKALDYSDCIPIPHRM